jgi:hypothetical protein
MSGMEGDPSLVSMCDLMLGLARVGNHRGDRERRAAG